MALNLLKPSALLALVATILPITPAHAAEAWPALPTWKCTTSGGCVQQNTSVVLDQDSKFAKGAAGSRTTEDYAAMGITTSGNAVTMYHYVRSSNGQLNNATPRIYLLGADGKYVMMSLLNQELSVDSELDALPCGENGAFYLSEMTADGSGKGAGAGNGYCDAQCQGFCCSEMDILEANSQGTLMTGHPCKGNTCEKGGCGYNPYAAGQRNFWGRGKTVDTSKKFTTITRFVASGDRLTRIERTYVQNGKEIPSGSITSCGAEGPTGGLPGMGQALGRGMVLAMAIWNDAAGNMAWLDAGNNGPCKAGEGSPQNIQSRYPDTHVTFSNIRWGDIGSTQK